MKLTVYPEYGIGGKMEIFAELSNDERMLAAARLNEDGTKDERFNSFLDKLCDPRYNLKKN